MVQIVIDDTDSRLVLSGSWSSSGMLQDNMGTASLTSTKGASATITFTGSSIGVYGRLNTEVSVAAVSSYSVDGGSVSSFTQTRTPPGTAYTYHRLFYQSPTLSEGKHTLLITNMQADTFVLDYFIVTTADNAPPPTSAVTISPAVQPTVTATAPGNSAQPLSTTSLSSSLSNSSPSSATSKSSGSLPNSPGSASVSTLLATVTADASSHPSGEVVANAGSHSNVAAIVGGVLGGIILLAVLIAILLWQRRKRRKELNLRSLAEAAERPEPFDSDSESSQVDLKLRNETVALPSSSSYYAVPPPLTSTSTEVEYSIGTPSPLESSNAGAASRITSSGISVAVPAVHSPLQSHPAASSLAENSRASQLTYDFEPPPPAYYSGIP